MVNRLLTALILMLGFFLLTAPLQSVSAQAPKKHTGYVALIKQIIVIRVQSAGVKGSKTNQLPIATPTIYVKPSVTPTLSPRPTTKVTPMQTTSTNRSVTQSQPTPTKSEIKSESTPSSSTPPGDTISYIMSEINKYRASHGLSSVETSSETCGFAATRASEIVSDFSHAGFQKRIDSKTVPYSSFSAITENLAMHADYTKVVEMWANSPGHAANMRADTPFVCVRQSGSYYSYQGMKP